LIFQAEIWGKMAKKYAKSKKNPSWAKNMHFYRQNIKKKNGNK